MIIDRELEFVKGVTMNNRTLRAVEGQITAMGVDVFEVGLFKLGAASSSPVEPEMLPRVWDRKTLLGSVSWLRYQNSLGRNIYIRPLGEHPLSLVDDLNAASIARMKADGYTPCAIVETSPGNFQAWLNHGQVLPRRLSSAVARSLADVFGGDRGAADWRHYGRLAGFTNRKEKYRDAAGQFPFVLLIEAELKVYPKARQFVQEVADRASEQVMRPPAWTPPSLPSDRLQTIEQFRAKSAYAGDGNRIDLAYAIYALSHGVPEADVRAAIASRDLSKKGSESRQVDYLDRTIAKALQSITGENLQLAPRRSSAGRAR